VVSGAGIDAQRKDLVLVARLAALAALAAARRSGLAAFAIFAAAGRSGRSGRTGGQGDRSSEDKSSEQRFDHILGIGWIGFEFKSSGKSPTSHAPELSMTNAAFHVNCFLCHEIHFAEATRRLSIRRRA
jgi:hypothetical protein